eukprot:5964464-Pyramimonas_sp.AAC.1
MKVARSKPRPEDTARLCLRSSLAADAPPASANLIIRTSCSRSSSEGAHATAPHCSNSGPLR